MSDLQTEDRLLTIRQHQVMTLLVQGYSNTEIGRKLFLSPSSIKQTLTSISESLPSSDGRNRAALTAWYLGWRNATLVSAARAAVQSPDEKRMADLANALKVLGY